jgi:hypothetical protein
LPLLKKNNIELVPISRLLNNKTAISNQQKTAED